MPSSLTIYQFPNSVSIPHYKSLRIYPLLFLSLSLPSVRQPSSPVLITTSERINQYPGLPPSNPLPTVELELLFSNTWGRLFTSRLGPSPPFCALLYDAGARNLQTPSSRLPCNWFLVQFCRCEPLADRKAEVGRRNSPVFQLLLDFTVAAIPVPRAFSTLYTSRGPPWMVGAPAIR